MQKKLMIVFIAAVAIVLSGCSHGPILQDLKPYSKNIFRDRDAKYNSPVIKLSASVSDPLNTNLIETNPDYIVDRKDIVTLSFYECIDVKQKSECEKYKQVPIKIDWVNDQGLLETLQNNRLSWRFHLSILGDLASLGKSTAIRIKSTEGAEEILQINLDPFRNLALDKSNSITDPIPLSYIIDQIVSQQYATAINNKKSNSSHRTIWPSIHGTYGVNLFLSQQQDYFVFPGDKLIFHKFKKSVENETPVINTYQEIEVTGNGEILLPPTTTTVSWSGDDLAPPEESHLRLIQQQLDMSSFRIKVNGSDLRVKDYPSLHLISSCLSADFRPTYVYDSTELASLCADYWIQGLTEPKHDEVNSLQRISIIPKNIYWTLVDDKGVRHEVPYVAGQTVTDSVKRFYEQNFGNTLISIAKPFASKVALTVLPGRVNPRNRFTTNPTSPFWGWVGDCWVVKDDDLINDCQPDLESDQPLLYPFDTVFVSTNAPKLPN